MPNKETLISYIWNGLRPLIWSQLDGRGQQLDNWEEAIKKPIDVEAKVAYQPLAFFKAIDSWCTRRYQTLENDNYENVVKAKKLPSSSLANYITR